MTKKECKEFSITIRSSNKDLLAFMKLESIRKKRIQKASNHRITADSMKELTQKLHPKRQYLIISEIKDETKTTKTFRLVPDPDSNTNELAFFRAGQYLSLKVQVNDISITRPYSISSSPSNALNGFYEITIRKVANGFLTEHIWNNWKVGTKVESSGPEGFFYYEPLRDRKQVVGIGGGSGITPFRSLIREIENGNLDMKLTILYGSSNEHDIIYYDEFKELEEKNPDKIKIVHVLSCEVVTLKGYERGFITSNIIEKYVDVNNSTFFVCGPQVMHDFIDKELERLKISPKRIRKEAYGEIKDILKYPRFPQEVAEKIFKIKVTIGDVSKEIPAIATESVLVAMERANLVPPSVCRSGECGLCRSLLMSGDVFISPACDGRRAADKKFNFFHPCSSYPITNLEIIVPRTGDK